MSTRAAHNGRSMPRIFLSYRRNDAAGHAGRIFDRLERAFGSDNVFMDVAGIGPGENFAEAIDRRISDCEVVLVVMGREWLGQGDAEGGETARIAHEHDFVRAEVMAALRLKKVVIPVLVNGAALPSRDMLPGDLVELLALNAIRLHDDGFREDVTRLIQAIKRTKGKAEVTLLTLQLTTGAAVIFVAVLVLMLLQR